MTTTPTFTGQDIGQAEKATRAVLDRLLARTGTGFRGWVILNQLSAAGGVMDAAGLASRVSYGLKIGPADVQDALSELGSQNLVSEVPSAGGAAQVTLTPTGRARFSQVQAGIGEITQRLYGGLPAADLAVAHQVLATVTERANAELAG
jgi:hypothetical protein